MKYILLLVLNLCWCLAVFAQKTGTTVLIKNEPTVNTAGLEFSPAFFEDGIVFVSTNSAGLEKIEDENIKLSTMSILRARRDGEGILMAPEPFARELTSKYHEGPVCFSPTGDAVFFSRNTLVDGQEKLAKDGVQKMRLYTAPKAGEGWGTAEDLKFNVGEFDDCHPSISIDGDKLYFASNRPGGFGGMDLYVAYRIHTGWSEPVNLGGTVNTKGNEVFPFIHADNTLYFASDGHAGEGGMDIFQTRWERDNWSAPVALPKPFNTAGDDFGLIVDLNKINGYISSNGQGGLGQDDIFSFKTEGGTLDDFVRQEKPLAEGSNDLIITVVDADTKTPVQNADVRILSLDLGDVIGRDEAGNLITIQTQDGQDILRSVKPHAGLSGTTDRKGRYGTTLHPGNYSFTIAHDGYQTNQMNILVDGNNKRITAELVRVKDKVQWNASVFNYLTNEPLTGATAIVINRQNGKRDTILTDENGRVSYYLDPNTTYGVELYQGGRLIGTTEVESGPLGGKPMAQTITVTPLLPGSSVELPNIYYNYNDATLRPDARKDLDMVVTLMKQHAGMQVELSSHTDCRGTASYNQSLSQRRANGVVEYLVTKGISRNRLMPIGHGESQPRNSCVDGVNCEELEHARNRRTEVRMISGPQGASMITTEGGYDPQPVSIPSDPVPVAGNGTEKINTRPVKYSSQSVTTVSSSDLEFYVIAGSFLMSNRADTQLSTLVSAGYADAEIIRFNGSEYYSVCAKKFTTRRDAEELERRLEKRDKIDAYVRAVPRG
jgi:outer membrane protein OmpA-like peptidoglycan-associated protein